MKRNNAILYVAFLAELLLLFYLRDSSRFILSPLLMTLAGLTLSVVPMLAVATLRTEDAPLDPLRRWKWMTPWIALSVIYCICAWKVFEANPVNIANSDIIPLIKDLYLQRFFNGEFVYAPVTGYGYGTWTPNYLPLHWGPFILSAICHMDHRWIPVLFFLAATFLFTREATKTNTGMPGFLLHMCLPFLLLFSILWKQTADFAHTVELLIMSWYLFLSVSFFSRSPVARALGVIGPLLSRYSFAFWLPAYFAYLFRAGTRKFFVFLVTLIVLSGVLYIVPFLLKDPGIFMRGNQAWETAALGEWKGQSWQAPGDAPFQLFQGVGFASWFYTYYPGNLLEKLSACRTALLAMSLLAGIVCLVITWRYKGRRGDLLQLCLLKGFLTVFYACMIVPYVYLFWVPMVVSIVILVKSHERRQHIN